MKKLLYFIFHRVDRKHIVKQYYESLHYYEYKVYSFYKLFSIIPIRIRTDTFDSIINKAKYTNLVMSTNNFTETLKLN